MPDLATLLLFAVTGLTLVAIPGPNHVYIVARSIDQGRRAGARLRASAAFARRRRHVAGGVYLALAAIALVGGRRAT